MAKGKEKATGIEPSFNIDAVMDAANLGSNSLRMSTNSTDWVDRFFHLIQLLRKTYLSDVIILYRRALQSIRQPIKAEAATVAKSPIAFLEKIIRFLQISRTDLMRSSEGYVQRFMIQTVLYIERAKATNPAPLQNHSRTPSLQQNGNCLQFCEPELVQNHCGSSIGMQNADSSSFKNSLQYSLIESNQVESPQISFLSVASPSAVPSSSTPSPSSIPAVQEECLLSFHPLSIEESNKVTEAPTEPSPRLSESSCMGDYQPSDSEADPSQRLVKSSNDMLLQEIRKINESLIETVVDVVDAEEISQTSSIKETVIRCSYNGVRCNGNKMMNASMRPFPNLFLEWIVPDDYPNSSPIILERFRPGHSESEEVRAVRKKATSNFSSSLWNLSRPISITSMAKIWDICAREEYPEFAYKFGGGDC